MSANAWLSDEPARVRSPARQRALGRVAFSAVCFDGCTRVGRIAESGSMRIRLPRSEGRGLDAVLVNTAGGIACGDQFAVDVHARAGTCLTLATPAAEKVYRSDGPTAEIRVNLVLDASARLDWLPQETILFDQARLARRLDAELPGNASLSLFEATVFGREASRESLVEGSFEDRWRIRRDGRLAYADTLRLSGPVSELLRKPSVANGARAVATFLYVAPDAEARLEEARSCLLPDDGCDAAASAWNGLLVTRFCAVSIEPLRRAAQRFLLSFRRAPLPRVWLS